jgi:hypothetical protein
MLMNGAPKLHCRRLRRDAHAQVQARRSATSLSGRERTAPSPDFRTLSLGDTAIGRIIAFSCPVCRRPDRRRINSDPNCCSLRSEPCTRCDCPTPADGTRPIHGTIESPSGHKGSTVSVLSATAPRRRQLRAQAGLPPRCESPMAQSFYLREQADRCRRLARGTNDPVTQERLLKLAAEYEAESQDTADGDSPGQARRG